MIYDVPKIQGLSGVAGGFASGPFDAAYRGEMYGMESGASETEITERTTEEPTTSGDLCAFGSILRHDGNVFLQGGQISGGAGSFAETEIDLGPAGSLPTTGFCVVRINYTALTDSGVLLAGGDVTSVVYTAHVASVDPSDMPTAVDPDGFIYVVLATYTDLGVAPTNCGNINVFHCPGSLYANRDSFA